MKQLIAQIIVVVVLVLVIGFFAWMFRSRRASRTAGTTALTALARELGTTYTPSRAPSLSGTFRGRRCTLQQARRQASNDDAPYVHLEIACAARTAFQIHRSQPSLAGVMPADLVRTGHEEFDIQLWVRSPDAERAKRILTPDLQTRLLDWFTRGWLDGIWWKDGHLLIDGGYGLREDWEVEAARRLLEAGTEIAEGLE